MANDPKVAELMELLKEALPVLRNMPAHRVWPPSAAASIYAAEFALIRRIEAELAAAPEPPAVAEGKGPEIVAIGDSLTKGELYVKNTETMMLRGTAKNGYVLCVNLTRQQCAETRRYMNVENAYDFRFILDGIDVTMSYDELVSILQTRCER